MQLAGNNNMVPALGRACCALLGSTPLTVMAAQPWQMDLGLMNYIEAERNTGLELMLRGERALQDGGSFMISGVLDVITGATPNGATASNVPQTFTMASGAGSYSVDANELPVDDTHMDTRLGVSTRISIPHSERLALDYKAHISMEFDFLSLGSGVDMSYALNARNTHLLMSIDAEYDRIHPVGNLPIGFAVMAAEDTQQPRGEASVSRRVQGVAAGFSQVINRQALMQLKYAYTKYSGYLTDPYKLLSVIEDTDPANLGSTLEYLYEKRPQQRDMQSIYTAIKYKPGNNQIDLSYRYLWDDWSLQSNTLEMKYRIALQNRNYLQPQLRLYQQSAAEFYQHSLPASEPVADFASADFRLAEFDALTLGLRYGELLGNDREYSISVEYYRQSGDSHPADAIGIQRQQDLFPTLHTLIIKYIYSYQW